jgi:ATP-dependent Clp protease ATP-binding subunit ClpA
MEKLNYPFLSFKLADHTVLGVLVDIGLEAVETDLARLKTLFSNYIKKEIIQKRFFSRVNLRDPRLKIVEFQLRPTIRFEDTAFPLTGKMTLSTPLVFGEGEPGVYVCYLPVLKKIFYCYDLQQLEILTQYFIHLAIDQLEPERLYRMAAYPIPTLEVITFPGKKSREYRPAWNFRQPPKVLESLADPYPYPKAIQRNLSAWPDAAWELEIYVEEAKQKLSQRANVLVVGEPGAGKSAIIRQVLRKMNTHSRQPDAENQSWRIQAQQFTATSKYLGEWQETLETLVEELDSIGGLLWIENIVRLLQEGGRGVEDSVAAYLLPFLQLGKIRVIGEVTPQELESIRRLLPGLAESFQLVFVPEMPEKSVHVVLEKFSLHILQQSKIHLSRDVESMAFRLLKRFYPYESFPGKGIRFLGECVNNALFYRKNEVTKQDVLLHFINRTGLPELFLRDDLLLDQGALKDYFTSRIIGQAEAVDKVCDIIKVFKAGLNNPHKPITTLIFAGPTGVGKTACAQALAQYFFGKGQKQTPLIRIDMSEFQYPGQITRFLGAGREPGKLVADVRERHFAVLLLDEVEKASPAIFDAFLNVLDEGMLVDAYGRVTNFRNCIIILTTNLGSSNRSSIGYGRKMQDDDVYGTAIGNFFRPEFFNRIDSVVIFRPLLPESIGLIVNKELEEAKQREGFQKLGLELVFSDRLTGYLAEIGFHEKYGARPLQRALEDYILKPLAIWLLEHPGVKDCRILVDYSGEMTINAVAKGEK